MIKYQVDVDREGAKRSLYLIVIISSPFPTFLYPLTFRITGLPNFWQKNNLKFLGGTPPSGPLKIKKIQNFQN